MLMIFPTLFYNYKVVGYEVTFLLTKYQNFCPSELKILKKRSNSAAVFTRLAYVDVRTLGSGVGLLYSMSLFGSVFILVLSYICEQVVHLQIVVSSLS